MPQPKLLGETMGRRHFKVRVGQIVERLPRVPEELALLLEELANWNPERGDRNDAVVRLTQETFPDQVTFPPLWLDDHTGKDAAWDTAWGPFHDPVFRIRPDLRENEDWQNLRRRVPTIVQPLWSRIWPDVHDVAYWMSRGFTHLRGAEGIINGQTASDDEWDALEAVQLLNETLVISRERNWLEECLFKTLSQTMCDVVCAYGLGEDELAASLAAFIRGSYFEGHFLLGIAVDDTGAAGSPLIIVKNEN